MRANQLRLYFSSFAYILLNELRRVGLAGTKLAHAYVGTIRLRLIKVATVVTVSVRRIRLAFSSAFPMWQLFRQALEKIRSGFPTPA